MKYSFLAAALTLQTLWAESPSPISLFNGKNLEGWDVLVGREVVNSETQEIFKVTDGIIHVYPSQEQGSKQPFAGIVTTKSYQDYHLTVEYRWGEKKFAPRDKSVRDAGILYHIKNPNKIWPSSVELQIQEGDTGDLWIIGCQASSRVDPVTGGYGGSKKELLTRPLNLKTHYSKIARSYSWEKPGWNKTEIIVRGDDAVFKVNGHQVNECIDSKLIVTTDSGRKTEPLTKGHILLQAEGAEIFYRNITITPLSEEK